MPVTEQALEHNQAAQDVLRVSVDAMLNPQARRRTGRHAHAVTHVRGQCA